MIERTDAGAERERLLGRIREYLHEEREIDPDRVQEDVAFREELLIDSLDLAAMALALEDEYGIRLDDVQIMTITTVGDALDLVLSHVPAHRGERMTGVES